MTAVMMISLVACGNTGSGEEAKEPETVGEFLRQDFVTNSEGSAQEVVLVDLRYISSNMIGQFVDFKNADVLFLYSTMLLNNSMTLKQKMFHKFHEIS